MIRNATLSIIAIVVIVAIVVIIVAFFGAQGNIIEDTHCMVKNFQQKLLNLHSA